MKRRILYIMLIMAGLLMPTSGCIWVGLGACAAAGPHFGKKAHDTHTAEKAAVLAANDRGQPMMWPTTEEE